MRILLINGNTSPIITERVAEEARRMASTDTVIDAVTAEFGASLILSRTDNAIAAHAVITAIAGHSARADAAIPMKVLARSTVDRDRAHQMATVGAEAVRRAMTIAIIEIAATATTFVSCRWMCCEHRWRWSPRRVLSETESTASGWMMR